MNIEIARKNLTSDNPDNVIAGLHAIGQSGQLADLQPVLALIQNANAVIKKTAVETTSLIIRENLLTRFHELEKGVREKLGMLMQSLDPLVIDDIGKDLYCDNDQRRLRAVQILGLLRKNPRIREILAKLVQDRDVKIRATAVNLFGKVIGPNDHELILSLLNDEDKRVRANTVEALESLGNKRLVPILLRFRHDANNRIRGNVLKALHKLGYTQIEGDLNEMLVAANNFMKASALWVISQAKIVSPILEDAAGHCLASDNEMVMINARKALSAMETPRALGYLKYLDFPSETPVAVEK